MSDFLDEKVLRIKRYQDIKSDMEINLLEALGQTVDTSSNAIIGQLQEIIAIELARPWEVTEVVYNAFSLYNAEGKSLEDLVALGGLIRRGASPSYGNAAFTGSNNTNVPVNSIVSDIHGNKFNTTSSISIVNTLCHSLTIQAVNILPEYTYWVSIGAATFNYTTVEGDTAIEIAEGLAEAINNFEEGLYTATTEEDLLTIRSDTPDGQYTITYDPYFSTEEVTSLGEIIAQDYGAIIIPIGVITSI